MGSFLAGRRVEPIHGGAGALYLTTKLMVDPASTFVPGMGS